MALFGNKKFFTTDGSFENEMILTLIQNASNAIKTGKKPLLKSFSNGGWAAIVIGWVKEKDVWKFVNKLSNFLSSWVDLKTAFGILARQMKVSRMKQVVEEIRQNLDYGISISETLHQFDRYFDPLIVALVEVGEKTGSLPRILNELDRKLLDRIELKARIRGALIYPAFLLVLTICVVIFMMTFIVPNITKAFVTAHVELPTLTQEMVNFSNLLIDHPILIISVCVWSLFGLYMFGKVKMGKRFYAQISLRIPVFGFINRQNNIISFIQSLNLLLESGVLMIEALDITSRVVSNEIYREEIIRIKGEVESGIKMSNAMGLIQQDKEVYFSSKLFPEDFVHMIGVGEETGTISKTIEKIGATYTTELRRFIGNLMAALEPFIIVFIGFIVGVIVLAIMLPFFNMAKVAKNL